jgi:hypothetical protein
MPKRESGWRTALSATVAEGALRYCGEGRIITGNFVPRRPMYP